MGKKREKPISLYGLDVDDALRAAMQVKPMKPTKKTVKKRKPKK